MTGICKYFNHGRGFGFVSISDDLGQPFLDLFFHQRSVIGYIPMLGDQLEFWIDDDPAQPGKWVAVEVSVRTPGIHIPIRGDQVIEYTEPESGPVL